jgi:hypothetical protein
VAIAGCAVDGERVDQALEPIALGPAPLVEPGIDQSFPVAVYGPVSFAGGPTGWFATWSVISWGSGQYHAMAARIGPGGELVDRPAFTLSPSPYDRDFAYGSASLGDRWLARSTSGMATVPASGTPRLTPLAAVSCREFSCDAAGCLCAGGPTFQRLDATGAAAGPELSLGPAPGRTAIATAATQWLVVFESTHPDTGASDLRLNRVRRDGTVRDGAGAVFTTIAAGRTQPAVASDGTAFLVVFVAMAGSGSRTPGIYAQRIEASEGIVVAPPVLLAAGTEVSLPSVAWDGARYWVAWQRQTCSNADCTAPGEYARLAQDGTLLDTAPRTIGVNTRRPKVAVSAGRVAMLWQEREQGPAVFQRFRADGTAESAAAWMTHHAEMGSAPALASDGSRFALTCQATTESVAARAWLFGANGAFESAAGVTHDGAAPNSLFWDGVRYRGVTGTTISPVFPAVPAAQVVLSADGRTFTRVALPTLPPMNSYVSRPWAAALVGGVTFIETSGSTSSGTTTYGVMRLDAAGAPLDPLPIAFGSNGILVSDGTVLLGVWSLGTSLRAARVSREGDVLDATAWDWSYTPPGSTPEAFYPSAAAYGGGVWTVVGRTQGMSAPLRLRQASASGTFLRSIPLPGSMFTAGDATLAWNGQEFVVAAVVGVSARLLEGTVRAWSVRPDGTVSPPEGMVLDPMSSASQPIGSSNLAIATLANGTTAVAWARSDPQRATWRCVARILQPGMGTDAGAAVDAGIDAAIDRPEVAVVDVGAVVDVAVPTGDATIADAPTADGAALLDAEAHDVPASDAGSRDATVPTDTAARTDAPVGTDAPAWVDAVDAGAPTAAPEGDGGCDVGGVAGARSRSPLAASLPLLALALATGARRRRARRLHRRR